MPRGQVTASRIHYETTQKELENKLLQQEVESKQRTLIFTWLLVGLLAALLVSGGLYTQKDLYGRTDCHAAASGAE